MNLNTKKKNWKHLPFEELENLPYRERIWNNNWLNYRYEKIGDYTPWDIAKRICEHYIGKSFDDAFSHYCKLVPKHLQGKFHDQVSPRTHWSWRYCTYYLEDGIIRKKDKRSKIVTFTSDDYKEEYLSISTGTIWKTDKFLKYAFAYGSTAKERIKVRDTQFKLVVTSGFKKTFSSKNDYMYKRLTAERNQKQKRRHKQEQLERRNKEYCFLTKSELANKLDNEENDIKIVKHGFDLVTSFRN